MFEPKDDVYRKRVEQERRRTEIQDEAPTEAEADSILGECGLGPGPTLDEGNES